MNRLNASGSAGTRPFFVHLSGLALIIFLATAARNESRSQQPLPAQQPTLAPTAPATNQSLNPLTLDQALRLANTQASAYQQAILNERIAGQDVRQAQAAFLPRVSSPTAYIYTSPSPLVSGAPPGT